MSKTVSASFCKGKGSIAHNNREFFTSNIDQDRTPDNIVYKQEPLKEAYQKCFGEAIEKYNNKQKRADRKIDGVSGYMEKIKKSGNGEKLFYETVVQVGTMYNCNTRTADGEKAQQILDEFMKGFEARNPHLYVFNAVMHLDEETPHLHIDYIPVAEGYKQGMQVRNSLDKALKQQGIDGAASKTQNSTIAWEKRERKELASCIERAGWEYVEVHGVERGNLTINQYRAMTEELNKAVEAIEVDITPRPNKFNKEEVIVKSDELERLLERAKLSKVHEETTKHLQEVASSKFENINYYTDQQMLVLQQLRSEAEAAAIAAKEKEKAAEQMKQQYENKYNSQLNLNENYNKAVTAYNELKNKYNDLVGKANQVITQNKGLRQQIDDLKQSIDIKVSEAVTTATEPLQATIDSLKERLDEICDVYKNTVKAFNMLKYDKDTGGYGLSLPDKQSRLFDALERYTTHWLRKAGKEDMAVDIEKNIGFSRGISDRIKELEPKQHSQGRDR